MNSEKLRVTFKNPNFESFYELGKCLRWTLRPRFKNPKLTLRVNWEKLCPNLSFTVENKDGNLLKIRLDTFQTKHHEFFEF